MAKKMTKTNTMLFKEEQSALIYLKTQLQDYQSILQNKENKDNNKCDAVLCTYW